MPMVYVNHVRVNDGGTLLIHTRVTTSSAGTCRQMWLTGNNSASQLQNQYFILIGRLLCSFQTVITFMYIKINTV